MVDMGTVLAVNLEAKINKLEKEMRRASEIGARTFDGLDRRSKKSARDVELNMERAGAAVRMSLGTLDKVLLGGLATGGLIAFGNGIQDMVHGVAALSDEAKRAGTDLKSFQEWKFVAEQNRIPIDAMTDALKELSIRADEFATTGKGSAADAFARLGMTPEEVQRKLADPSALLLELIDRTRQLGNTAAGVRSFDELFGGTGGERLVALLSQSQDQLRGTIQQAHDLGLVLSDDLVSGAAELDAKFNAVAGTVGSALKSAIVEAAIALNDFIERFAAFDQQTTRGLNNRLREVGARRVELENQIIRQQGMLDRGETGWFGVNAPAIAEQIEQAKTDMAGLLDQEKEILAILNERDPIVLTPPPATPPPAPAPPAGGGSSGGRSGGGSSRNAYAELVAGAREFIAAQQLEQQTIGMTVEAAATLRQQHELLNKAQQAGLSLTPQQRAEIEQLGAAMAAAEEKTRQLTQAQQGAQQAGQFLGDGLSNSFADVILGAQSAEDAIKGLVAQLARAAIQAALMGSGPLGGLTGGTGILSGLFGFADGGYTGAGGKHVPAGVVHKGEVVWSQDDVRRHGGAAVVDAMRRLPRFADGGVVGKVPALPGARVAAPSVTISPQINVTVEGGSRGAEADAELGRTVGREIENTVRGLVSDEIIKLARPGNILAGTI